MITKKQIEFLKNCNSRFNFLWGSVRSGKTFITNLKWIQYCKTAPEGNLLMSGKTERTLKRNVLDPIANILGNDFHYGNGEVVIGGRKCDIVGVNDSRSEERIRGATLAGAYCDEISLYTENFFDMLATRLSVKGSQLFGTSNPDSPYHWFKTQYLDNTARDIYHIQFLLDDNIENLDPLFVKDLKDSYSGLFYKRFILGEWVLAEGLIYDMFNDDNIVKHDDRTYQHTIIGIDYGMSNPCVFLKIKFNDNQRVIISDEYYHEYKNQVITDSDLADDLLKFCEGDKITAVYVDPSAVSFINELKKRRFRVREADNSVLPGLAFCSQMFNKKHLLISEKCKETLKERSLYSWDTKSQLKGEDKPLKQHDHACDAFRYPVYTYFSKYSNFSKIVSGKAGGRLDKYAGY